MSVVENNTLSWPSSELLVAFQFAHAGYGVSMPLHPQLCAYDLVVDAGGHLYRMQVKRASWHRARYRKHGRGDRACFRVFMIRGTKHQHLNRRAFDYLCVVCDPQTIFVIPVERLVRQNGSNGELVKHMEFKPPIDNNRRDSAEAAARWLPYLNKFTLEGV